MTIDEDLAPVHGFEHLRLNHVLWRPKQNYLPWLAKFRS